jgi:2-keto-4-pentenoate hydratase
LVGIVLEHNGEVVATAAGAASDGHPASAVAELAARLAAAGDPLRAGDIVVTDALASVGEVRAGDVLVASIGRVGAVEAAVG